MIDFKDVTFIIPIKFDSEDRKNNFKITINYLLKNFDTNIIVMESDKISNEEFIKSISDKIIYFFEKNETNLFHRTKLLNYMTKMSKTNIIVNYDIDVIFKLEQYIESRNKLLHNCDFCFPYSGKFYDIKKEFFNFIENNDFNSIDLNRCTLFNPNSVGGAIFFNKDVYEKIGLENENFVSWGHEDWERIIRIQKMGYNLCRVYGILYHLTHFRDYNGSSSNPHYSKNEQEFNKVNLMNKEQLSEYISTWRWI